MVSIGKANRFAGVFGVRTGEDGLGLAMRAMAGYGKARCVADWQGKVPSFGRIGRVADCSRRDRAWLLMASRGVARRGTFLERRYDF